MSAAVLRPERRFLLSTLAGYRSQLARLGIGFASRIILARLLLPEIHGLYEQALRIVILAAAVRDLGVPYHLMRDPRKPYGTVLVFTLLSGLTIGIGLVAVAPVFAFLAPELPAVVRALSVWLLIDALGVVPRVFFDRELRIDRLILPEVLRGVAVAGVAIVMARFGYGVWSLVTGELVAASAYSAIVWRRAWGEIPITVHFAWMKELIHQSRWLFIVWVGVQLVTYIDLFIVQTFSTTAQVGQYYQAYRLAFLVPMIVAPRALLPALVQYQDDAGRFAGAFRVGTVLLMSLQVTGAYFLLLNAPKVVEVLLGSQWQPAIGILRVLSLVPLLEVFTDLGGEVLKVRGQDRTWLVTVLVNLACLVGFGIPFTARWGAMGMAWANFLLLGNVIMAWRMTHVFGRGPMKLLARDLLTVYGLPIPFFAIAAWATPGAGWSRFAATAVAAGLGAGLLALRFRDSFSLFFGDRDGAQGAQTE